MTTAPMESLSLKQSSWDVRRRGIPATDLDVVGDSATVHQCFDDPEQGRSIIIYDTTDCSRSKATIVVALQDTTAVFSSFPEFEPAEGQARELVHLYDSEYNLDPHPTDLSSDHKPSETNTAPLQECLECKHLPEAETTLLTTNQTIHPTAHKIWFSATCTRHDDQSPKTKIDQLLTYGSPEILAEAIEFGAVTQAAVGEYVDEESVAQETLELLQHEPTFTATS